MQIWLTIFWNPAKTLSWIRCKTSRAWCLMLLMVRNLRQPICWPKLNWSLWIRNNLWTVSNSWAASSTVFFTMGQAIRMTCLPSLIKSIRHRRLWKKFLKEITLKHYWHPKRRFSLLRMMPNKSICRKSPTKERNLILLLNPVVNYTTNTSVAAWIPSYSRKCAKAAVWLTRHGPVCWSQAIWQILICYAHRLLRRMTRW